METSQIGGISEILTMPDKLKADAHDYRLITKASEEFDRFAFEIIKNKKCDKIFLLQRQLRWMY